MRTAAPRRTEASRRRWTRENPRPHATHYPSNRELSVRQLRGTRNRMNSVEVFVQLLFPVPDFNLRLKIQPEVLACPKEPRKPQRHIHTKPPAVVDNVEN